MLAPAPTSRMNSGKSLNIQSTLSSPHVPTCTHMHTPTRTHTQPHPPPPLPGALRVCASERAGGQVGAESGARSGPPCSWPGISGSLLHRQLPLQEDLKAPGSSLPLRTIPPQPACRGLPQPLLPSGQEGTPRWARGFAK